MNVISFLKDRILLYVLHLVCMIALGGFLLELLEQVKRTGQTAGKGGAHR